MDDNIKTAVRSLRQGKVIAYPTEAVYGLGCDPFNIDAVSQVLRIKGRTFEKGFILVAANWDQVEHLVEPIEPAALARVFATWPGPNTWLFPANDNVPHWIRGRFANVAIRISDHPIIQALCETFAGPIISTSANKMGYPPTRDYRTTLMTFGDQVDFIVKGETGKRLRETTITNAVTGEIIREG